MPSSRATPPSRADSEDVPDWARRLRASQRFRAHAHTAVQALKEGDKPGAGAHPNLDQRE